MGPSIPITDCILAGAVLPVDADDCGCCWVCAGAAGREFVLGGACCCGIEEEDTVTFA